MPNGLVLKRGWNVGGKSEVWPQVGYGLAVHVPTQAVGSAALMTEGVAGLPCFLGDADEWLQRLAFEGEGFSREIWLVVHRDLKRSPPIRAVMDFLIEVVGSTRALQQVRI